MTVWAAQVWWSIGWKWGLRHYRCLAAEVSGVSWGDERQVVYTADAVTGGIRVVVWGRDLGLPSEVRWVEPATIKGPENLLWGGCAPPKGIPDDGG